MTRVVVPVAVELDRELVIRPAAVDAAVPSHPVRYRKEQSGFLETTYESRLKPAECDSHFTVKHSPKLASAGGVRQTLKDRVDLARRGPVLDACLVACPRECPLGQ
jgi:hypothetical protein